MTKRSTPADVPSDKIVSFGKKAFPKRWPLAVAMGAITVAATGFTMLFDDGATELLAEYPTIFWISDAVVFLFSSVLAATAYWLIIGRPIRALADIVQQMAEHVDSGSVPQFTSRLYEIQNLKTSVSKLRSRLVNDEQRAMRLASDMIQVAKASGDWLWREDRHYRFTEVINVNPNVEGAIEVEGRVGKTRSEIANHPDDQPALAALQRVLDARETFRDFRYRRVRPDGSVAWYATSGIPTFNENGEFAGYRGTSREITTEMRAAESRASLERLNGRLAAAIAQSSDGIALVDPNIADRPIVYVNAAFARITGHDMEQILGCPSIVLEQGCADDSVRERLAESIEARRRYNGLIPTRRPDGSVFWNDLTVTPVFDDAEMITGFVWNFSDVSAQVEQEQKDAAAAIRNAQHQKMEALGTLAGGIAHDLNNTLVPVLGLSKLLLNTAAADAPNRKPLEAIVGASERARGLVRQILDFSRAGSGEVQAINLADEMRKAQTVIRAAIATTAAVEFAVGDNELWVLFDPGKLYQILINLAANSFDALPDGKGHIRFVLAKDPADNRACLTIEDDGTGMSAETLERALEPFFTTKGVGKGTGLGLSIIHGIITGVGGDIRLASAPGEGTRVEIFLPLVSAPHALQSADHGTGLAAMEVGG